MESYGEVQGSSCNRIDKNLSKLFPKRLPDAWKSAVCLEHLEESLGTLRIPFDFAVIPANDPITQILTEIADPLRPVPSVIGIHYLFNSDVVVSVINSLIGQIKATIFTISRSENVLDMKFSLLPLVAVGCNVARIATEKTKVVLDTTFTFLRLQLPIATQLVGVTRRSRPDWALAFVTVGSGANRGVERRVERSSGGR